MTRSPSLAALFALTFLSMPTAAHAADKSFGLTSFERLSLEGDFIVIVTTGNQYRAVASGPQDALDRVAIEQVGTTLSIREKRFASARPRGAGAITIRISAPNLKSVAVQGAGSLTVDQMRGQRGEIGLRGPGVLRIGQLAIDNLSVAIVGNGVMTLGGTAKNATLLTSGAFSLDAVRLKVSDLSIDAEGAGDIRINAVRSAKVMARGVGTIAVDGRPACSVQNLSSANVICGSK